MVVEGNADMQDLFRDTLKRAGYRVLIIADPARAVNRCLQDPTAADCVVFDAQLIGKPAVECFNQLGDEPETQLTPAVLLLGERQRAWQDEARIAPHRLVLGMPVNMKQLRTLLEQLAPAKTNVARSENLAAAEGPLYSRSWVWGFWSWVGARTLWNFRSGSQDQSPKTQFPRPKPTTS